MAADQRINFYQQSDPLYGCFSNFSPHSIELDGKVWPTSEHYFQAKKFLDPAVQEVVRLCGTPAEAALCGRDRSRPLRSGWEFVKENVMRKALRAKFEQNPALRAVLLGTGNALLVEHTENDSYWGDGGDDSGRNRLGFLLMELRDQLAK